MWGTPERATGGEFWHVRAGMGADMNAPKPVDLPWLGQGTQARALQRVGPETQASCEDRPMTDTDACPMPGDGQAPPDGLIAELLAKVDNVAVVGASPNPERTSHQIAVWLMNNTPYQVFLINPTAIGEEIRGHGFYSSLADLPVKPHLVDVFRRPEHVPAVAAEAISAGAVGLWLQLGIVHEAAATAAQDAGMTVVQNRCIKVEYSRLAQQIDSHRLA